MEIVVEVPDFNAVITYIRRRADRLRNIDTPLERIRDDFYAMEKEWFETEGGSQWTPLSPRYAAWKDKAYPGKTILRRDDRLFQAVTGQPGDAEVRSSELHIYLRGVPYWRAHDQGIGRLPVRKVISEQIKVRRVQWAQWVTDWLGPPRT